MTLVTVHCPLHSGLFLRLWGTKEKKKKEERKIRELNRLLIEAMSSSASGAKKHSSHQKKNFRDPQGTNCSQEQDVLKLHLSAPSGRPNTDLAEDITTSKLAESSLNCPQPLRGATCTTSARSAGTCLEIPGCSPRGR